MDPKRDLMAALAASLFLAGATGQARPTDQGGQLPGASQTDESWKTDPNVRKTADAIFGRLKNTTLTDAKTEAEITNMLPKADARSVDGALRYLLYDKRVRRFGDGTANNPYIYYVKSTGGGG